MGVHLLSILLKPFGPRTDTCHIEASVMSEHPEPQAVRRILLPSGRTIEVVHFGDTTDQRSGLHECCHCGSELVQPVAWSEAGHGDGDQGKWELTLECPNCGWLEVGTYDREQVDALEERLDQGLADMLDDLRRLTHVNMADELNRFVVALQADLILPEDF